MVQFHKKLSRLIRQELFLSSSTEAEIFALVHSQRSPGKIYSFLVNLYHLKILWVFPLSEQKRIVEFLCEKLSHHTDMKFYMKLINLSFMYTQHKQDREAGIRYFTEFITKSVESEGDTSTKAYLALLLLKIINKKPDFAPMVAAKEIVTCLITISDTVSFISVVNQLIRLFGTPTVMPLVIDLLIEHPRKVDGLLVYNLFEYILALRHDLKEMLIKKMQIFLSTKGASATIETLYQYHSRLIPELGRFENVRRTLSFPFTLHKTIGHMQIVKKNANTRFKILKQMKGGTLL